MIFKAKCPGSLMIVGEHAVLHGQPAIVSTINQFLEVQLEVRDKTSAQKTSQVIINSDINGGTKRELYLEQDFETAKPLEYILAVIKYFSFELNQLNKDYNFIIKSDIDPSMGLGSSAAIIIATIRVILDYICKNKISCNHQDILHIGKKILHQVQGVGSGADLAASIYGGVIWYHPKHESVEKIANSLPLAVVYSGYKLSTKEVIAKVSKAMTENTAATRFYQHVFEIIGDLVVAARDCIEKNDWSGLGELFNQHYGMQEAMGLSDLNISKIIYQLRDNKHIYGAKISGSGLGDCIIGIKDIEKELEQQLQFEQQAEIIKIN